MKASVNLNFKFELKSWWSLSYIYVEGALQVRELQSASLLAVNILFFSTRKKKEKKESKIYNAFELAWESYFSESPKLRFDLNCWFPINLFKWEKCRASLVTYSSDNEKGWVINIYDLYTRISVEVSYIQNHFFRDMRRQTKATTLAIIPNTMRTIRQRDQSWTS